MKHVLLAASLLLGQWALASPVTPDTLSAVATQHSIGLEWQVAGDTNHNASATVRYRVAGISPWKQAFDLLRIDYNGSNTVAGSVMYLAPGVEYELEVTLTDPDGGDQQQIISVATRPVPVKPAGGAGIHVQAGASGGTGSANQPFGSIAAALAIAGAGDTVVIHAGSYSNVSFSQSGTPGSYLVFEAAGDGEATVLGASVSGDHIWIEGLTFRDQSNALTSVGAPEDVVVHRNTFLNNHYGVYLSGGGYGWTITDNVIVGDNVYEQGSFSGEGVELNQTSGHTVAHNSISGTADGISYPLSDVDIFGNDIFNTSDDGIEGDNGRANVRVWGNRMQNLLHNGFTFQDQDGGPWYLLRNVIINYDESALKYRSTDRYVLMHNTFINWHKVVDHWGQNILNSVSRNNLFVSVDGGPMFRMIDPGFNYPLVLINWRTDLDYDGFDWAGYPVPFEYYGDSYSDLASMQASLGLWPNARQVNAVQCLPELGLVSGPTPMQVPPMHAQLQSPCAAIDAGTPVPNLSEGYLGTAPDLGAYEFNAPLPVYGPRPPVPDSDSDGVLDSFDNCTLQANPGQVDTDDDGIGNVCDADFDQNCITNFSDISLFAAQFAGVEPLYDLNVDGAVNFLDFSIVANNFLTAPGPGAAGACAN